uniref:HM00021 protein n=3 Tax=Heliconius melpomene TaxID=34740 RepID=C9S270_HELME|nr:HM00021 [Heliconius melpomene]CBH09262.1 HM00021 [Heliconius melpomene]
MIGVKQNVISECLYLQKEENNKVFLNDCQLLKQHQIDGLRFLFLQFKKKKPAAVVNFPPECGKSVTIALFLKVLKNIVDKPILILCNSKSEINVWNEIILKWTEYTTDDIAIDSSNVYIKKKIFIKYMEDLTQYLRRSWSILIIKDDLSKTTLKLAFDADFKICITSTDVKKDLKMLSTTYNWLTKLTMDPNDFMPSGISIREKIQKDVLLDSFLEDFLIQETRIEPFKKTQIHKPPDIDTKEVSSPKKSRKNKDASGKKVKRSKRKIDDNIITDNDCENQPTEENNDIIQKNNDHIDITADQNKHNENENSESTLENYENISDINMNQDNLTEEFTFGNAAQDIVEMKNILSNKSTESIDFDEIAMKIDNNDVNDKDCKDTLEECNESNDKCQREEKLTDNDEYFKMCDTKSADSKPTDSMDIGKLGDSVVKNDLVLKESIDIKQTGTELDINGECHKDIDAKISELEEKALKKFKGSLLDSIF